MSNTLIDDESYDLYHKVLDKYFNDPRHTRDATLGQSLAEYNAAIKDALMEEINRMIQSIKDGNASLKASPVTEADLDKMLAENARNVANATKSVMDEHMATDKQINDIMDRINAGDDYDSLKNDIANLPKGRDLLTEEKFNKAHTKTQRAALDKRLHRKNDSDFKKQLWVTLGEKSRYYGYRIYDTESKRAYQLDNIQDMIDKGVEFVRWDMNSRHKLPCICEVFNIMDLGWGEGIYPLMYAPVPVYSTHPHCFCTLNPQSNVDPNKKRAIEGDPISNALDKLNKRSQAAALGSKYNWRAWKAGGDPLLILNRSRGRYPIVAVGDIVK